MIDLRQSIPRTGIYKRFPSQKAYLKSFKLALKDWETTDLARLQRYTRESGFSDRYGDEPSGMVFTYDFPSAASDLNRLAIVRTWFAVQAALQNQPGWFDLWCQSVAYHYWAHRMGFRWTRFAVDQFRSHQWPQMNCVLFLERIGVGIGDCLALGWFDWAVDLARRAYDALTHNRDPRLYNDGDDSFGRRRTQHFVVRLIADWQGWPALEGPRCALDEPLFNALIEHWHTGNLDELTHLVLAACDRHTQQSRFDASSRETYYDLRDHAYWYDPFEILSILRLRTHLGLANPLLDHPLLATPLGRLSAVSAVYSDDLLDGVLKQARSHFPDM